MEMTEEMQKRDRKKYSCGKKGGERKKARDKAREKKRKEIERKGESKVNIERKRMEENE